MRCIHTPGDHVWSQMDRVETLKADLARWQDRAQTLRWPVMLCAKARRSRFKIIGDL